MLDIDNGMVVLKSMLVNRVLILVKSLGDVLKQKFIM